MLQAIDYYDQRVIRGWFRNQVGVKLLVILGFTITIILVMTGIYFTSSQFLGWLKDYEAYGTMIARYTLHAAIIVVCLTAILSYTASLYGSLVASRQSAYWLTLPIRGKEITRALSWRVLLFGSWPLLVLLAPFMAAWLKVWPQSQTELMPYLLIPSLALGCFAVGIWGLVLVQKMIRRLGKHSWWILTVMAIAGLYLLIRFMFPPALFKLHESESDSQFTMAFEQLPLMSPYLPTWWLTQTLAGNGFEAILRLIVMVGIFASISERYLEKKHLGYWYYRHERLVLAGKELGSRKRRFYWPATKNVSLNLAWVEWLRLRRSSGDLVYWLFVLILTALFAGIMAIFPKKMPIQTEWAPLLYGAVITGFGFLTTVMAIRFIYPLMAIEGKEVWQVFSAPVKRWRLLDAKTLFSLLLIAPWIALALFASKSLPLLGTEEWFFGLTLIATTLGILIINLTLGFIAPNFSEQDSPSATSTSTSGLLALILSIGFVAAAVKFFLNQGQMSLEMYGWSILMMVLTTLGLGFWAMYRLYRYEKIG